MKKRLLKWKYQKLTLLIATFILAYLLFYGKKFPAFNNFIISTGYIGIFISGLLFSYGFTSAPAAALFLLLAKSTNIFLATLMGGAGALFSDIIIFQYIRTQFDDEIRQLSKEKIVKQINKAMPSWLKLYLLPVLASFIIASPLPDEIGVALLATTTKISLKTFALLSFILNSTGIFVLLIIGNSI